MANHPDETGRAIGELSVQARGYQWPVGMPCGRLGERKPGLATLGDDSARTRTVGRSGTVGLPSPTSTALAVAQCLVCMPLVNEILSHCQDLEQQIKASISITPSETHAVPDDVNTNWERFRERRDETTRYPDNHPAPPDKPEDAWFFASLGQFLNAPESPLSRSYTDEERSLSRLRNTMAHGHYASWFHLKLLRKIMQTCSP